ncbi:MAG: hypothetical protein HC899_30015 [Leptolyngbyaceae cyanobacterium SM1_4_3]|nr:hypothetical protein [Leptolyngbyaceae cyanobacterium SM1_4_3]
MAPSTQPPTPYRTPSTNASSDRPLSALRHHRQSQTTATTDNLLGAFGLTDNLQERVQDLNAEPANGEAQRRQITFASPPRSLFRPLQRSVRLLATSPIYDFSNIPVLGYNA